MTFGTVLNNVMGMEPCLMQIILLLLYCYCIPSIFCPQAILM